MSYIYVIKERLKDYSVEVGLYEQIQYSLLHQYYIKLFNQERIDNQRKILDFHKEFLPPKKLVFDIGANVGDKTEAYLDLNSRVVAVDPDQKNTKILKRRFRNNSALMVVEKAISSHEGKQTLYIQEPGSAYNTLSKKWKNQLEQGDNSNTRSTLNFSQSVEVSTTTLDKLIDLYGLPYYIKIDVEGHELDAIKGLHHQIPLISFEVNLPEFKQETIELILLLYDLNKDSVFNYAIDDVSGFILEDWRDCNYILNFIENTNMNYMEIFVRCNYLSGVTKHSEKKCNLSRC